MYNSKKNNMSMFTPLLPKTLVDDPLINQPSTSSKPTISSQSRQFIKLISDFQKYNGDDLDPIILAKAINNSTIQRMSNHNQHIKSANIINIVSDYAVKFAQKQKKQKRDISIRQWCIVEIDEEFLKNSGIGIIGENVINKVTCGHRCEGHITNQQRLQYNIINHIELPSTIRPYCLVLNMNGKELHFQSHQNAANHFFLNLDTVAVQLVGQNEPNKDILLKDVSNAQIYLNKPLILKTLDQNFSLEIKMYITPFTLPYPFKQFATPLQKLKYRLDARQSLYSLLQKSVNESRGRECNLRKVLDLALKNSFKFYNYRYVTQEQFTKYCQTGDLLLFKDNHTMAKIQRVVTSSPYDHVAIVFRSQQLGICLFESSSGTGVGLANWRTLIRHRWWQNIQKIAWRKLQMHIKPPNFEQKVNQFIKGNLHKQFGISLPKLLKFKSVTYTKEDHKTYFCSELVATLYKYLGLLEPEKSSSTYWPRDFADGNGIQILNGALDFERELVFEQEILKKTYPLLN